MWACGCGGMADAPASGAGGFTAVQVQVLSSAPIHKSLLQLLQETFLFYYLVRLIDISELNTLPEQ